MTLSYEFDRHMPTGMYLTVVEMEWLIGQRGQESFISHALKGSEDHSDIGQLVCDGLIQVHLAMKQHCMGES